MFIAVVYDVTDNRRRSKLFKWLSGFGMNQQLSLFECNLETKEYNRMFEGIRGIIDESKDKVTFYGLCAECLKGSKHLGRGELSTEQDVIVI